VEWSGGAALSLSYSGSLVEKILFSRDDPLIAPGQGQRCSSATTDTSTAAMIFSIGCCWEGNAKKAVYSARRRAGLASIWPALLVSIL
jgi:hypothetical protein